MILKILIRVSNTDGLLLEASPELIEKLSTGLTVSCTSDYNGILGGITRSGREVTMLLLTDEQVAKLTPAPPANV